MRKSSLFWGFVLVLLGGQLLLDNMNLLPRGWNAWEIFWPLALITLGVAMLTRATRAQQRRASGEVDVESLRLGLNGARSARVRFHHGAGELRVNSDAGSDDLVNGKFGGGVEHSLSRDGDMAVLNLRAPVTNLPIVLPFDTSDGFNWTVGLNPTIPLDLEMELGASRNLIDLSGLKVRNFKLSSGASAVEITFPANAGQTFAKLESGMASVELRIPEGVAARIRSSSGLAGVDIDTNRFPRSGGSDYLSPDYDRAANRLDLELETGLASVRVR